MNNTIKLEEIYLARPFRTRNADEYGIEEILDLFVDPTDGLNRPFDYENTIVKGKMGSGKTMYLRANYAFYIHTLVSDLMENNNIILPIYINLSDCQNILNSKEIYEKILFKINIGMVEICDNLISAEKMAEIHKGCQNIGMQLPSQKKLSEIKKKINLMSAAEYIEIIQKEIETEGKAAYKFFNLCKSERNKQQLELKKIGTPQFDDINNTYEQILKPFSGKLIILFDEVSSLNKDFFRENENEISYFEILMNQLRTLQFVRTKVAIYPYSICDVLMETRYGDNVQLESDIYSGYESYLNRIITLIDRYLQNASHEIAKAEDLFEISNDEMRPIEQLLFASNGNMRRLVHLIDLTMDCAYRRNSGKEKITTDDVFEAIKKQARDCESLFTYSENEWLSSIIKVCRSRSTYRFMFPNKTVNLAKYINRSSEYNIINVIENGAGRKGSTYEFDYAYCVYKDIPTHYIEGTERLDKLRSNKNGNLIKKVTRITDTLIQQAVIPGKIEGEVTFINSKKDYYFVNGDDGTEYTFSNTNIIEDDKKKKILVSKRVRFIPHSLGELLLAEEVEIL
ncbi:hypothetical protein RZO55_14450 [Clostridium boliviensis]|uniref:DNA helicase n=1 Tax=Clostridium boliviensis TaxID=318465 RepID=A0ABU4GMD0_9CLOT|nr:hypothetical protein [Clostridium boliviensis]MDW2798776.1 hypothetical protein [Clostridium boliviensis]